MTACHGRARVARPHMTFAALAGHATARLAAHAAPEIRRRPALDLPLAVATSPVGSAPVPRAAARAGSRSAVRRSPERPPGSRDRGRSAGSHCRREDRRACAA
jgi:hypothetical protein